jgi:hypothetical protein
MHAFASSLTRCKCPAHHILHYFIILIIFVEEYKLWSSHYLFCCGSRIYAPTFTSRSMCMSQQCDTDIHFSEDFAFIHRALWNEKWMVLPSASKTMRPLAWAWTT